MAASTQNIIKAGFEILAKNIELSLVEYTSVSRCQADIEAYLGKYITTFTTELSGAFARNTIVSPLKGSVVDLLVLLNEKHSSTFLPNDLLGKLHVTLLAKYPGTTFDKMSESVYVPIENFRFRVQPGFLTEQNHYLVPGPGWNDWVEYDSLGYKSQFSKANAEHGGKLLNLVRMMKTWNRLSGNAFDGYFLELLVKDVINGYEIVTYQAAINYVFKTILADVAVKKHDPANQSLQVEGLHNLENIVNAMIHVKSSYLVTEEAIRDEEEEDVRSALLKWGQLFPNHLPKLKL
jgi:hypothetical protein